MDMISIVKFSKRHNSVKFVGGYYDPWPLHVLQ